MVSMVLLTIFAIMSGNTGSNGRQRIGYQETGEQETEGIGFFEGNNCEAKKDRIYDG